MTQLSPITDRIAHPIPAHQITPVAAPSPRQLVVMLKRFGGPDCLELSEPPMPTPGPKEVRVRVLAASVQFTDTILRRGKYPGLKQKPPLILGYDVVGEIDDVGTEVSAFGKGDRVAALTITGSYARYRLLLEDDLVRVPAGSIPPRLARSC